MYKELLQDYPDLLDGYKIELDEFDYDINPVIYYELSTRITEEELKLIVNYIDQNREKLTNYEITKAVYKLTNGKITLTFTDIEQIVYYFELPETRQKYNKLYFPNLKRYVKYHDMRDFRSLRYQEKLKNKETENG